MALLSHYTAAEFIWKQSSGMWMMVVDRKCWKKRRREGENQRMWGGKLAAAAEMEGNREKIKETNGRMETNLKLHLQSHTPLCRKCHPRQCLSTCLRPLLPRRPL